MVSQVDYALLGSGFAGLGDWGCSNRSSLLVAALDEDFDIVDGHKSITGGDDFSIVVYDACGSDHTVLPDRSGCWVETNG